jgi:hypothetical protein
MRGKQNKFLNQRRVANPQSLNAEIPRKEMTFANLIRGKKISDFYSRWRELDNVVNNFKLVPNQKPFLPLEKIFNQDRRSFIYNEHTKDQELPNGSTSFQLTCPDELVTLIWELQARELHTSSAVKYKFKPEQMELAALLLCLRLSDFRQKLKPVQDVEDTAVRFGMKNALEDEKTINVEIDLFHSNFRDDVSGYYEICYQPIKFSEWEKDALYYLFSLLQEMGCKLKA